MVAEAIRQGYKSVSIYPNLEEVDEHDFPEGRVLYRMHRQRERNSSLVKKKKQSAKNLACDACGKKVLLCVDATFILHDATTT